jgi:DNA-binding transcriptional ArsR family regulator
MYYILLSPFFITIASSLFFRLAYREFPIYLCFMDQVEIFKALSNKTRLQILNWLKEPELNFPEQKQHAGFDNGVCVGQIQMKAGLTQSTVSEYLSVLQRAGLVRSTRVGQWTYYQRNEEAFALLTQLIQSEI